VCISAEEGGPYNLEAMKLDKRPKETWPNENLQCDRLIAKHPRFAVKSI
jgi:hypothetical protein